MQLSNQMAERAKKRIEGRTSNKFVSTFPAFMWQAEKSSRFAGWWNRRRRPHKWKHCEVLYAGPYKSKNSEIRCHKSLLKPQSRQLSQQYVLRRRVPKLGSLTKPDGISATLAWSFGVPAAFKPARFP